MNWIQQKAKLEKQICCLKEQIAIITPSGVVIPSYQREVTVINTPIEGTPYAAIMSLSICGRTVPNSYTYNWDGVAIEDFLQSLVDYLNTNLGFLGEWSLVGTTIILDGTLILACQDSIVITVAAD